jgi:hypothetical protein
MKVMIKGNLRETPLNPVHRVFKKPCDIYLFPFI